MALIAATRDEKGLLELGVSAGVIAVIGASAPGYR